MVFNRFRIIVTSLCILIGLTSYLFVWSLEKDYIVVGKFLIAVLWLIEIQILIRFVNRTNTSLTIFLEALKSSDFVNQYKLSNNELNLNLSYNNIIDIVKRAKLDEQSQYQYFQYTLEHISTGIISFKKDGTIDLFNEAAKNILGIKKLKTISDLRSIEKSLSEEIKNIDVGKNKIIPLNNNNSEKRILIKVSRFILMGEVITLLSLQDIKFELDSEELNAWQKLIRVLTHEIMNSVGPMKSITTTTLNLFKNKQKVKKICDINDEIIEDAVLGLQTLEERNKGLMNFVKSYKKLMKVPKPDRKAFRVSELIDNVKQLFNDDFICNQIQVSFLISDDIENIEADENLLTQVIINLIKNAIEALDGCKNKTIKLSAFVKNEMNYIEISDNGNGMTEEVKTQIFVPFYTTKNEGDGIGLSLSRQIIQAHGGDITVESKENKGARFIIRI